MIQKTGTQLYKGLHRALRCEVLDSSLELGLPADFPVLRCVTTGPHKLVTAPAVLGHLCNQKDPQVRLEQLELSKTNTSTRP
jgi:hypothetical protein